MSAGGVRGAGRAGPVSVGLAAAVIAAGLVAIVVAPVANAAAVTLTVSESADRGQVTVQFPPPPASAAGAPAGATAAGEPGTPLLGAETRNGRLYVRFAQPVEGKLDVFSRLRGLTGAAWTQDGGRTLVVPIRRGVTALAVPDGDRVLLDFAQLQKPQAASPVGLSAPAGPADALPSATAAPPRTKVVMRVGQHPGFSRLVFDWQSRVGYRVETDGAEVRVIFDRPADIDVGNVRRRRPAFINDAVPEAAADGTAQVRLRIPQGATVTHYADRDKVVVDVAPAAASAPNPVGAVPLPAAEATTGRSPADATPPPPTVPAAAPAVAPPAPVIPTTPAPAPPPAVSPVPPPAVLPTAKDSQGEVRFAWERPVGAVSFRRGDVFWLVFDQASEADVDGIRRSLSLPRNGVAQLPHPRATVLRLDAGTASPQLDPDGGGWRLRWMEGAGSPPTAPIRPVVATETATSGKNARARLILSVTEPGEPLVLTDPVVGDTLVVVPTLPPGSGVDGGYRYPQLELPATWQGVAVIPAADGVSVRSYPDRVEITHPDGLVLSVPAKGGPRAVPSETRSKPAAEPTRLLDPRDWGDGGVAAVGRRRRVLERRIVDAALGQRETPRLQLAQFLIGNGFGAEALAQLTLARDERRELEREPAFHLLRGVAALQMGRLGEATDALGKSGPSDEARLWAAAVDVAAGRPPPDPGAAQPAWSALALSYPPVLRIPLLLAIAEVALAAQRPADAQTAIEVALAQANSAQERGQALFLDGQRLAAAGDSDAAARRWQEAADADPRRGRARAERARVMLLHSEGKMSGEDAIAALEALRYAWRGDATEVQLLRTLGALQMAEGDPAAGLQTLKQAAADASGTGDAEQIAGEMTAAFEKLFVEGDGGRMSPLAALTLYENFKELTPAGPRGERVRAALVDRLLQLDLLDRAAAQLQTQIADAGGAEERARLGLRLAEVRLQDGQADAALTALQATAGGPLPDPLRRARDLQQARALAALHRGEEALAWLALDDSLDAQLLRARIYRDRGDWKAAAQALQRVVEAAGEAQAPLDERRARDILDLAVALTLARNNVELAQMDRDWGAAMAATPMKDVFRFIAGSVPAPEADAKSLAQLVERAMAFRTAAAAASASTSAPAPAPVAAPPEPAAPAPAGKP